jgi:perosamine synthetase
MQIPFARPCLTGGEAMAVTEVIESGWVSQGPRVKAFEDAFAARVGAPEAVATTSCTTALQLALYASGVGPGDEVIVPSLSFIATAHLQPRRRRGRTGHHRKHAGDHARSPVGAAG